MQTPPRCTVCAADGRPRFSRARRVHRRWHHQSALTRGHPSPRRAHRMLQVRTDEEGRCGTRRPGEAAGVSGEMALSATGALPVHAQEQWGNAARVWQWLRGRRAWQTRGGKAMSPSCSLSYRNNAFPVAIVTASSCRGCPARKRSCRVPTYRTLATPCRPAAARAACAVSTRTRPARKGVQDGKGRQFGNCLSDVKRHRR